MSKAKRLLAPVSTVLMSMVLGIAPVQADKAKPKALPAETVSLHFARVEITASMVDGSPGPKVNLEGVLHLLSQTLVSQDGVPVGFTLHTNLADARASSADGAESYVGVGASDGIPAECQPESCSPPFWMLTFRLVQEGAALKPSLVFNLTVRTQYDSDGTLTGACVVGEDGCEDHPPVAVAPGQAARYNGQMPRRGASAPRVVGRAAAGDDLNG
ncbi:MAG TPA: hypothetical protein VFF44_07225 [Casimicrobiaceae bacterium]|nr:hypothetical protein [Casimicrobiaceae bacterium]